MFHIFYILYIYVYILMGICKFTSYLTADFALNK